MALTCWRGVIFPADFHGHRYLGSGYQVTDAISIFEKIFCLFLDAKSSKIENEIARLPSGNSSGELVY
jgi:hypothetical protein